MKIMPSWIRMLIPAVQDRIAGYRVYKPHCDVSPFSNEYDAMKDVPIVIPGMAYDDPESGETFILILSQVLYLGERMKNKR